MSLGSFTLLISRECDTYYKTRFQKLIHRVDALRFPHFDCFVKERGACAPVRSALHSDMNATLITRADEPRRKAGGANRDRTDDLLLAKQALSQLSYGPSRTAIRNVCSRWWVWEELNFRPHPYQGCALTN